VIAFDIYSSKTGDQFADCLWVKLPKVAVKRKAIRAVCAQWSKRKLGAFQPDKDIGETHLYLFLAGSEHNQAVAHFVKGQCAVGWTLLQQAF
jgi:hypothetical protein